MMKKLFILVVLLSLIGRIRAQDNAVITKYFADLNAKLVANVCKDGEGPLITNRAMNLYLSRRVGYYLSGYSDLSFYKNYITMNAADGVFSLGHNLYQPKDSDDPIRSFFVVGAKANVANAYYAIMSQKQFSNEFGGTLKFSWLGKVRTFHHDNCGEATDKDKQGADAARSFILHELIAEAEAADKELESITRSITDADVPGQQATVVRQAALDRKHHQLQQELSLKFASQQADYFESGHPFKRLSTNWTNLSAYIPLIARKYIVAPNLTDAIKAKYDYPVEIGIAHVRYEELSWGRFFLQGSVRTFFSSNAENNTLGKMSRSSYISSGGQDLAGLNNVAPDMIYFGKFDSYPIVDAGIKLVYFPNDSHIGASIGISRTYGTYHTTDATVGVPITLIDKKGVPAADFLFQLVFHDLSNDLAGSSSLNNKVSVGFSIGVPFSKFIF